MNYIEIILYENYNLHILCLVKREWSPLNDNFFCVEILPFKLLRFKKDLW